MKNLRNKIVNTNNVFVNFSSIIRCRGHATLRDWDVKTTHNFHTNIFVNIKVSDCADTAASRHGPR